MLQYVHCYEQRLIQTDRSQLDFYLLIHCYWHSNEAYKIFNWVAGVNSIQFNRSQLDYYLLIHNYWHSNEVNKIFMFDAEIPC